MTSKTSWADPRLIAAELTDEENLVFLYSGTDAGKKSFIASKLKQEFNSLDGLKPSLPLFGFLNYEVKNQLEDFSQDEDSYIQLPEIWFGDFENVQTIDYKESKQSFAANKVKVKSFESNMSDEEYLAKAAHIIECINAGDLYQANLTRKFYGEFESTPNPFEIFCQLSEISPAPYSAYVKIGGKHIISASPEKFLSIEDGIVTTSPIKGTMPLTNTAEDLANSEKDKAENLMIVDLMRNDLSKTCDNVKVDELFKIVTHKKYHHMHSTITAEVKTNPLDVTLGCFPPGSMTGAPKIKAMQLCSELEGINRGIYSGALGWISEDSCDLSVVIRTIIIEGNKFEFQAGGAIVADSTPEKELAEINTKIAAIREVLNV